MYIKTHYVFSVQEQMKTANVVNSILSADVKRADAR